MKRETLPLFEPQNIFGVDFSGAAQAGKNAWLATLEVIQGQRLRLARLQRLGRAAGDMAREVVNEFLVQSILTSQRAIWGMDFPFGLPIELGLGPWRDQLRHVRQHDGDARTYGRELVNLSRQVGDQMHIRRVTDRETQTPFDCYHYRIIYQTFHGMRDVLARIAGDRATAVLPFQTRRVVNSAVGRHQDSAVNGYQGAVERIVMEACPSSTLKRLELPHRLYKQSGDRPPDEIHCKNRRIILKSISQVVSLSPYQRRVIMQNPGGDALDAVLAGMGAWQAWCREDHIAIARHRRYPREGKVYC